MIEREWEWDYAFHSKAEADYPKVVCEEIKAMADEIAELANLGVDPNEIGKETRGTARRHSLPCGGWFETQILSRSRPRLIAVVAVVSPPNLR